MNHQPNLRACDDEPDVDDLIRTALEQVDRTYEQLAQVVMFTTTDNALLTAITRAKAFNAQMLSALRHPSGGGS